MDLRSAAVLLLALLGAAAAGEPPQIDAIPGRSLGRAETRWIAPFVAVTSRQVGDRASTAVRCYAEDGSVRFEAEGPEVGAQPGFLFVGGAEVRATNGDWTIRLAPEKLRDGYVDATADSRLLVHQWHPEPGVIAVDLYERGRLCTTRGPWPQYRGTGVRLSRDGSVGLIVWKTAERRTLLALAIGPEGNVGCRVACDAPVDVVAAAPDGAGLLARGDEGLVFYGEGRRLATFAVAANARFVCWLPGARTALFARDAELAAIDCGTGRTIWTADVLVTSDDSIVVAPPHVLVCALDDGKVVAAAVDVANGAVVARWSPDAALWSDHVEVPRLVRVGKRVFVLARDEFAEIDLAEIARGTGGWTRVAH